jgi:hypothetical protein
MQPRKSLLSVLTGAVRWWVYERLRGIAETGVQIKMPINSRVKGSTFERLIAKDIIAAFAAHGITNKDCYRTPLSGGHFAARKSDGGDLVTSPTLRAWFPYSLEAKHHRAIDLNPLMVEAAIKRGQIPVWWAQCRKAASETKQHPLLVFHGNGRETYAMAVLNATPAAKITATSAPYIVTEIAQTRVIIMRWKRFLGRVVFHATGDREGLYR